MRADILLCPCCASHLRPPPELRLMRCDHCRADLAMIHEGGVTGLAIVPAVGDVPYSTPAQRDRAVADPMDVRALVADRRVIRHVAALHRLARWSLVLWATVGVTALAATAGATGFYALLNRNEAHLENATLAVLGAIIVVPMLAYVALFCQGRLQLARAEVMKWSS